MKTDHSVDVLRPIRTVDIPHLDAPPAYRKTTPHQGIQRIILPSGHIAYHFNSYHEVKQVLADNRFIRSICNEEGGASFLPVSSPKELLLNIDAPDHARLRKVVAKDFSSTSVALMRKMVVDVMHARLDEMPKSGNIADLFSVVLDHIPSTINCHLMGISPDDRAYYRPLTHTVQIGSQENIDELLREFGLAYEYLMDLVTGKRTSRENGLINQFKAARNESDPPLTDKELAGILLCILIAGDQNLLSFMTKGVYTLLAAPSLWNSLVEDPSRIPDMVEELLRVIPLGTISTFPRVASVDIEGSWGKIERDAVVYADAFAANRDPDVFPDPLAIQSDRKNPKHLQFGYGMHNCMGASLARMEVIAVLEILIARLPGLRLAVPANDVPWVHGTILRRPTSLPVCWPVI